MRTFPGGRGGWLVQFLLGIFFAFEFTYLKVKREGLASQILRNLRPGLYTSPLEKRSFTS